MFRLLYWWNHRKDTPQQRHQNFLKAKAEVVIAMREVQESLKDEPATKVVHELYNILDESCEVLEE